MALAKAEEELSGGIASVTSVLGHPPAPFIRIPGLARTNAIDEYLGSQKLMTWSADFPADDWTKISPTQVYTRALQRIEAYGKGILLLHDIQPRTVEALPTLLHELKRRGYRIVHVVPATPDLPKTATLPSEWVVHHHMRQIWPASFAETDETILATVLPAPSPANFGRRRIRSTRWPTTKPAAATAATNGEDRARPQHVPSGGQCGTIAAGGLAARLQRIPGGARPRGAARAEPGQLQLSRDVADALAAGPRVDGGAARPGADGGTGRRCDGDADPPLAPGLAGARRAREPVVPPMPASRRLAPAPDEHGQAKRRRNFRSPHERSDMRASSPPGCRFAHPGYMTLSVGLRP